MANHIVQIQTLGFDPQNITIQHGDTVTWQDVTTGTHTASSFAQPGSPYYFDTGPLVNGQWHTQAFGTPGEIPYRDRFNVSKQGSVHVL